MADAKKPDSKKPDAAAAPAAAEQAQSQQPVQVQVEDQNALATYANFCRVTGSPEELIVDFGLNPQPIGVPKDPIQVKQRVILNFYTAKRLLAALQNVGCPPRVGVWGIGNRHQQAGSSRPGSTTRSHGRKKELILFVESNLTNPGLSLRTGFFMVLS